MKRTILWMCAIAASASLIPFAGAELTQGTCDVAFHVSATMHKFTGSVTGDPLALKWDGDTASWNAQVEVENMTTDNMKRDKEMFHMFHSDQHPLIIGQAEGVALAALKAGDTFPVRLTIGEETRELPATVSEVASDEDGGLALTVSFDVSLREYGLVPPKVLFFKVKDQVTVDAAYHFTP